MIMTVVLSAAENLQKEIQVCNFVLQHLVLLETLGDVGIKKVRMELETNLNSQGLSNDSKRLIQRLDDACNDVEDYQSMEKTIEDDANDESTVNSAHDVGFGLGASLFLGDPTPLIMMAGKAMLDSYDTNKKSRRLIEENKKILMRQLSRYYREVSERQTQLMEEHNIQTNQFITKADYVRYCELEKEDGSNKAGELYKIALRYPTFRGVWFSYGQCLFKQKKYDDAYNAFEKAVKIPNSLCIRDGMIVKAITEMGACKYYMGDHSESRKIIEKAIELAPDYDRPHYLLAYIYWAEENYGKALEYIQKAKDELNSKNPYLFPYTADLYMKLKYPEKEVWNILMSAFKAGIGPEFFRTACCTDEMRKFMKRDDVIEAIKPKLTAYLNYGTIYDDIVIRNWSSYPVTNIKITVRIKHKYDGELNSSDRTEYETTIPQIPAEGGRYELTDCFSVTGSLPVSVSIQYTCDQTQYMWFWSDKTKKYTQIRQ